MSKLKYLCLVLGFLMLFGVLAGAEASAADDACKGELNGVVTDVWNKVKIMFTPEGADIVNILANFGNPRLKYLTCFAAQPPGANPTEELEEFNEVLEDFNRIDRVGFALKEAAIVSADVSDSDKIALEVNFKATYEGRQTGINRVIGNIQNAEIKAAMNEILIDTNSKLGGSASSGSAPSGGGGGGGSSSSGGGGDAPPPASGGAPPPTDSGVPGDGMDGMDAGGEEDIPVVNCTTMSYSCVAPADCSVANLISDPAATCDGTNVCCNITSSAPPADGQEGGNACTDAGYTCETACTGVAMAGYNAACTPNVCCNETVADEPEPDPEPTTCTSAGYTCVPKNYNCVGTHMSGYDSTCTSGVCCDGTERTAYYCIWGWPQTITNYATGATVQQCPGSKPKCHSFAGLNDGVAACCTVGTRDVGSDTATKCTIYAGSLDDISTDTENGVLRTIPTDSSTGATGGAVIRVVSPLMGIIDWIKSLF